MNRVYKYSIFASFFYLVFMAGCKEEEMVPTSGNGKVILVLDMLESSVPEALKIGTRKENVSHVYLTVQTEDGKPTDINQSEVEFSWSDQKLVVEGITLPLGEYQVTEVLVKDYTNEITYASPLLFSKLADEVNHALPLHVRVSSNEEHLDLEVISTLGQSPGDFGFDGSEISFKDEVACDGGIYVGDMFLQTQEQIDEFGSKCYNGIKGNLYIYPREKLIDLSPLRSLKFIEEKLTIMEFKEVIDLYGGGNDNLVSLYGLHNLEYIGVISLGPVRSLKSLEGLRGLKEVVNFYINDLPQLKNLNGMESLERCGILRINSCESITDLTGLDKIEEIRILQLNHNKSLTSLHGVPNLKSVGNLTLNDNEKIQNLAGLFETDLLAISELAISGSNLKSLKGLLSENLKIDKSLDIDSNTQLTSLEGLYFSEEISKYIHIIGNENLEDISVLDQIKSPGYLLKIDRNAKLKSLKGLQNITKMSGGEFDVIRIQNNPVLDDFCALSPFLNTSPKVAWETKNNAFNPTVHEIIDGNCLQ